MRMRLNVLLTVVGLGFPAALHAQVPTLDAAQRVVLQDRVMELNRPAEFVLRYRADLALTAPQVARLETMASAQRDSAVVRQARMVEQMRTASTNSALASATSWGGPIDEPGLRDALCQQSAAQMAILLGIAWDRRAVAAVLTPAQVAQLPAIQQAAMLEAITRR